MHNFRVRQIRNFFEKWKQRKDTQNTSTWNIEFSFLEFWKLFVYKDEFQINCASRGFHVCRNIWSPKTGQNLVVRQEVGNYHDPFPMSVRANIPGKLTNLDIVEQIPRKISRFCHYFVNYGGFIEARVRESKYRPSPISNGGLEIPITLIIKKGNSTREVFEKMEKKKKELYIELEKIIRSNSDMSVDFEADLVPEKQSTESEVNANDSPVERENSNKMRSWKTLGIKKTSPYL